jgi:hypothetical protein
MEFKRPSLWRRAKRAIIPTLFSGYFALAGCDKLMDSFGQKPEDPEPIVELKKDVWLLTDEGLEKLFLYDPNNGSFNFSQTLPQGIGAGSILGAGVSSKTPNGVLRRITSIDNSRTLLNSEQASLEELIYTGHINISHELNPSEISSYYSREGVEFSFENPENFSFNLSINTPLYDEDGDFLTTDDQLRLRGHIKFNYGLDFFMLARRGSLESLSFNTTVNKDIRLVVESGIPGLDLSQEIDLARYDFSPLVFYLPTPVPWPVVFTPKVKVVAGVKGLTADLKLDFEEMTSFETGIYYHEGTWNPSSNFSNDFIFGDPVISSRASIKGYAGPRLELMLYGVVGPSAQADGYLNFESDLLEPGVWKLFGGLEVLLGIRAEIFKWNLFAYQDKIIDYEKTLAEGQIAVQPPPPPSTQNGMIAYVTGSGDNRDISLINPDGSGHISLINSSEWESYPSWSPDKNRIAFNSKVPFTQDRNDVYIINLDGSGLTQLTFSDAEESDPNFSPDGNRIAYSSAYVSGHEQIYTMDTSGSNVIQVTEDYDHFYWDLFWSSNGLLYFYSNRDNSPGEIYSMNPDGSGILRLTNNQFYDRNPSVSPNGTKMAISTNRDGNYEIYIMDTDGLNPLNISNSSGTMDIQPSWSPDGTKIVYVSTSNPSDINSYELWIINSDGSGKVRLTNNNTIDASPRWSPP